jgi:hypothetical protein
LRKSVITKVLAGGLVLAGASFASAQTNGPLGLSARIGVFFPTNDLARDLSPNWFALGADWKWKEMPVSSVNPDTLAYLGVSIDYYSHGSDNSALPIVLNYNVRSGQFVYSGGLGIDFVRAGFGNKSGLCGQLGATYEFGNVPNPVFVQAKYFFSSRSELSGFGLFAGVRF